MAKKNNFPFDIATLKLRRPVRRPSKTTRFVVRNGDIVKEIVDLSKRKRKGFL
jgi:hypothetical protein